MAGKKNPGIDRAELEKIMRELDNLPQEGEKPAQDAEFLNPWNFGKKKITGKSIISASLPKELPEH